MRVKDCVAGAKVGLLEVVEVYQDTVEWPSGTKKVWFAKCRCECGEDTKVRVSNLGDAVRSCGCLLESVHRKHGYRQKDADWRLKRAYKAAAQAKARCENPKHPDYVWYGGRGIEFRFASVAAMATHILGLDGADDPALSIDRRDNDGHYEPGNIRWSTPSEQRANQRPRSKKTSVSADAQVAV